MNHPCDGRTDGRNCDSICALSIYAVARKKSLVSLNFGLQEIAENLTYGPENERVIEQLNVQ